MVVNHIHFVLQRVLGKMNIKKRDSLCHPVLYIDVYKLLTRSW